MKVFVVLEEESTLSGTVDIEIDPVEFEEWAGKPLGEATSKNLVDFLTAGRDTQGLLETLYEGTTVRERQHFDLVKVTLSALG